MRHSITIAPTSLAGGPFSPSLNSRAMPFARVLGETVSMMRPPGRSSVPRFRPVDTRRRAIGVSVVLAALAGVGAGAWAFGINADAPPSAGCQREVYAPPAPTGGLVNVYNSTQRAGLAIEVADQLRQRGFQIGEVDNDPERRKVRGTGELRISKNKDNAAANQQKEALQAWEAGMSVTREKASNETAVDYVIGERWEGLNPTAEAPPWIELKCIPVASGPGAKRGGIPVTTLHVGVGSGIAP